MKTHVSVLQLTNLNAVSIQLATMTNQWVASGSMAAEISFKLWLASGFRFHNVSTATIE